MERSRARTIAFTTLRVLATWAGFTAVIVLITPSEMMLSQTILLALVLGFAVMLVAERQRVNNHERERIDREINELKQHFKRCSCNARESRG